MFIRCTFVVFIQIFFYFQNLETTSELQRLVTLWSVIYKQNDGFATIINAEGAIMMWAYQRVPRLWKGICIGFNYRIINCTPILQSWPYGVKHTVITYTISHMHGSTTGQGHHWLSVKHNSFVNAIFALFRWGRAVHICASNLGQHRFR